MPGGPHGGEFTDVGGGGAEGGGEAGAAAPKIDPEVVNVGGDEWNKQTAERLEKEYAAAAPKLEKIVTEAVSSKAKVEAENEAPDPDNAPFVPDSWETMSGEQQSDAEQMYKDKTYSEYHQSEVDSWYENNAGDDAKSEVAYTFGHGPGAEHDAWAIDAINEWIAARDDLHVPFSAEQIAGAIKLEFDSGYGNYQTDYGEKHGVDITFDDDKLPDILPKDQPSLPGIEPQKPAAMLTQEMRDGIQDAVGKAFDKQAQHVLDHMDPPDYLDESIAEFQEEQWGQMDDKEKFNWISANTNMIDDLQKEYDDYFGDNKPGGETGALQLPSQFDPLESGGNAHDYSRTQQIARHLSIERAAQLMVERKIAKDMDMADARAIAKGMDRKLWDGWKGSSHGVEGVILQAAVHEELGGRLNPGMVDLAKAKEWAEKYYNGFDAVKAYVRGKWETTQYMLDQSGDNVVNVYRGIDMPGTKPPEVYPALTIAGGRGAEWKVKTTNQFKTKEEAETFQKSVEKESSPSISSVDKHNGAWLVNATRTFGSKKDAEDFSTKYKNDPNNPLQHRDAVTPDPSYSTTSYERLPDISIVRNGAASTSTDPRVSNRWDGDSGRVVLRASVPRTAVISVPAYGINIQSEHEVVVAGTAWKGWDAWAGKAPSFDAVKIGHQIAAG